MTRDTNRWFHARTLLGVLLCVPALPGCIASTGSDCEIVWVDCWCNGLLNDVTDCRDLRTMWVCELVPPTRPCWEGSLCEDYDVSCDDVCIQITANRAQCGTQGLSFDGPGGLAVGYLNPGDPDNRQPVMLFSSDYGSTWQMEAIPVTTTGCEGLRFLEVLFADPDLGWIRMSGGAVGCPPGLWKTTDGGASWHFCPFPASAQRGWVGSGRLHYANNLLLSAGLPAGLSEDDGETWTAIDPPVDDWPSGTLEKVTVDGFALPSGDASPLCVSGNGVMGRAAVYCGTPDGSSWRRTFQTETRILALSDNGAGEGRAFGVLAGTPARVIWTNDHGDSWEEYPVKGLGPAAEAELRFTGPGEGTLVLKVNGLVDSVLKRIGYEVRLAQWRVVGEFGHDIFHVIFVHTWSRLWSAGSQGGNVAYPTIQYTANSWYPWEGWNEATVGGTGDVRFTGIVLGIRGNPVAPP